MCVFCTNLNPVVCLSTSDEVSIMLLEGQTQKATLNQANIQDSCFKLSKLLFTENRAFVYEKNRKQDKTGTTLKIQSLLPITLYVLFITDK